MAMFSPFGDDEYNDDGTTPRRGSRYRPSQQPGATPTVGDPTAPTPPPPPAAPSTPAQSQQTADPALPPPPVVPVTRPRSDGVPGDAPADWVKVGANYYPTSQSVAADANSGAGWKDGMSPQSFQAANPYYGQTGYYGNLQQVQAQMAGRAQSAGIPQGVLGPGTYTQDPNGQPLWQPSMTPAQQVAQDQAFWNVTRFLQPQTSPTPTATPQASTAADPYHPAGYTSGVAAPPAPPAPPPYVGADPYHPPGYTPGISAGSVPPPPVLPPVGPPPTVPGSPVVDSMRPPAPAPPMRRPYNPTATPNIPGQPVTDFTYPVTGPPRAPGPRFGQPGQRRGLSRRTGRDIGGNG